MKTGMFVVVTTICLLGTVPEAAQSQQAGSPGAKHQLEEAIVQEIKT